MAVRFFNRYVLSCFISLLLVQTAAAQEAGPISSSVVLVLELVSETHVKPVTGLVVSDDGLVLVPADFVSEEAEIVVLDGGTDILANGRPAKIVDTSRPGGLALLSVEGLKRPGFVYSEGVVSSESTLHLEAFPPAEYIAKGAQPVWMPVQVLGDGSNSRLTVSPETPLPYVSGAIVNDCGYLAGLSLATGAQSLEPGKKPVVIFNDELDRNLSLLQINLPRAICGNQVQGAETPAETQDTGSVAAETSKTIEPEKDISEATELIAETPEPVLEDSSEPGPRTSAADPGKVETSNTIQRPSLWQNVPFWLLSLGLILLVVLIWKGIHFFRLTSMEAPHGSVSASDEPDTAQLQAGSDPASPGPRSAPLDEAEPPDMNALPHACNGVVVIEGLLDADTPFKRYCAVNTEQIDVVIGRGEADISIEHPAISRAHARLQSDAAFMTLSDLGSSNGTFIRDIPCLPGEVLFVETGDDVSLGDVRLRISLISKESELS